MRLYLDNYCFNRPFDDQTQRKIALESEAKLYAQDEIITGRFELVWSYYVKRLDGPIRLQQLSPPDTR
jgi:hypothetical protein